MLYNGTKTMGVTLGDNPLTNNLYVSNWKDGTLFPPPPSDFIITEDGQYMLDENAVNLITE